MEASSMRFLRDEGQWGKRSRDKDVRMEYKQTQHNIRTHTD